MKNIKVEYPSDRGVWGWHGCSVTTHHGHTDEYQPGQRLGTALGLRLSAGAPASWLSPDGTRLFPTVSPR